MRPNSRETTECRVCGTTIFFGLTARGERQPLEAEPNAAGSVMAYRGVRHWLARTPRRKQSAEQLALGELAEQLVIGEVAELVDDPRDHPPHPLEQLFMVHAGARCVPRAVQGDLFAVDAVDQGPAVATVPAPRNGRTSPPVIYNVKAGASNASPSATSEGATVIDWETRASRIAARRRTTARPSAGAQ
jgi:hypothetical protein